MKKLRYWSISLTAFLTFASAMLHAQSAGPQNSPGLGSQQNYPANPGYPNSQSLANSQATRTGVVNTKRCLEESKLGKQEKANFERMKQQMESILQDKERALEEIETKLEDDDYMDSISDEAASELKRKRRTIRNEGMQLQNQYMQTLQQANLKIVQKLTDTIAKASAQVAQESSNSPQPIEVIFTDEACTFYSPRLDVSERVIAKMNAIFDAEQRDNPSKPH